MIATIPPFVLIHMRNRKRHFRRAIAEMGPSGLDGAFSIVHTSSRTNGGRPSFISGHGRQARFVTRLHSSQRSTEIGATPVPAPKARGGPSNPPTCSRLEKSERSKLVARHFSRREHVGDSILFEDRWPPLVCLEYGLQCCSPGCCRSCQLGQKPWHHVAIAFRSTAAVSFSETVSLAAIAPTASEHATQHHITCEDCADVLQFKCGRPLPLPAFQHNLPCALARARAQSASRKLP